MSAVTSGYVDPESGLLCAWANGGTVCAVPDCEFPDARCFAVRRERGEVDTSEVRGERARLVADARASFQAWCEDASDANAQEFMVVYADALLLALDAANGRLRVEPS